METDNVIRIKIALPDFENEMDQEQEKPCNGQIAPDHDKFQPLGSYSLKFCCAQRIAVNQCINWFANFHDQRHISH